MEIEPITSNENYRKIIEQNIEHCLVKTAIKYPREYSGKVRDRFDLGNSYALVTTDRQSAFDRILASIPFKGQVLNQTSAWWFHQTSRIIQNHLISTPDPNVSIVQKAKPFPIEFIVRGFITGSSNTSLWVNYSSGQREYCGITFPDGLSKNQRLPTAVITPTTKEENHDRPIAPKEIISEGWMKPEHWDEASRKALELFLFGQETAARNGLVLVDTKYEMGLNEKNEVILLDEVHTPDSSRYWIKEGYEKRISSGKEPQNIDKEFLRLWFKDNCDPYEDKVLPVAPKNLVTELSMRYIYLYEKITGKGFDFGNSEDVNQRISVNLNKYLSSS